MPKLRIEVLCGGEISNIAVLISNHEQGIQLQIFGLDSLGSLNLILELSLGLEKRLVTLKAQL